MEEVEWFASYAYNHSVDLYGQGDAERCRHWSERAIGLAHCCDDGGRLEALLQDKFVQLKLDGGP